MKRRSATAALLERRIASTLEWFVGCDECAETLANIRRDISSVLAEMFGDRPPVLLATSFHDGRIVVRVVRRTLS